MTEIEIEIIKAEYKQHEKLMAEIVSNKSYSGAISSIAAFVVIEWLRMNSQPDIAIVAVAIIPLFISALLFFRLCFGQIFKFPGRAEEWSEWLQKRKAQLSTGSWPDTAEVDLRTDYYLRMQANIKQNRELILNRQPFVELAGILAMIPIVVVIIHVGYRFATAFWAGSRSDEILGQVGAAVDLVAEAAFRLFCLT